MNTEIKLQVKSLFAKAVNSGMTPEEASKLFEDSINEVQGN
ncbi:hypothetical protein M1M24_gp41 [Polaribacter phage Freya_1]|uniref:Uncharacterized protein n=1 Tax=Polaribacter phage Freya_1 TaxID=2745662 RepID=A0A8E5EBU2_9CAUD|nr:hypothetical protein M1M24_gp41 [Polaribacter phage Freya_1]QQV90978.1 hypothetical protein Freya2_41 [Polaribacter phage Freya_2]QQV91046.1 hypothetical protein Freya3_41 [Polaribacter phage Freya_3]QQV91114.1 hypothetical protein Freya4_41 [Polaribacter phage Freya_4]QQV91189.1 hypothetical protein Freya8_48 [Polaribacter phage Freya_8]QQV91266.1 hypothetical protein Freya9_50 [Polaribacter phage Freya_9]QQV91344.1 hypothetical protein Freya10_51 [Polaribacter phage Freya_10]QYV99923.1 